MQETYSDFFGLAPEKQHEEFLKYPIEKQFDIYIYAMTKRHPPDLAFANDIARSGGEVIPFLVTKLEQAGESVQQKIMLIFEMMARGKYYSFENNKNLIAKLEEVVLSMKHPLYKERSMKSLSAIVRN
jgi:hypothetical protein